MAKKGYGYFYFLDENGSLQMRKLTGKKRKEVLKNYLRRRSGREMKLETIANAFNVSTRSMQKLLKELRFTIDDLLEALRQKDIFDISQVQYAIVETNGQLSVLLKPEYDTVTRDDLDLEAEPQGYKCPGIIDGKINSQDFKICNMTTTKVEKIARKKNIQIKDILLMTVDTAGNHTIIRKEEI